tara:strand:+ start:38943 stop:39452 length:510 start_codon:yes stop_codon:yes gene_type:complete
MKNLLHLTSRQWFCLLFLGIAIILALSLFFQLGLGYEPCPLCEIQRFAFIFAEILLLVVIILHPRRMGIRIYAILTLFAIIIGAVFAGRQIWLQSLPPSQAPACGPGLNFMIHNLPLGEAVKEIFTGTADCALVPWSFLGLSFAGWAMVFYVLIAMVLVWQLVLPKHKA